MILPVALGIKPGKCRGKCRIIPAPGQPGSIVDQAQGAQRFNQVEFARIELLKILVPCQQIGHLPRHVGALA